MGKQLTYTLQWHPYYEPIVIPSGRSEVEVLLKVDNLPMGYLTATWDGRYFHIFSSFGYPDHPWTTMPNGIKVVEWAYIEN